MSSISRYLGDGATRVFAITFPYIHKDHIRVAVGGVETTSWSLQTASTIWFPTAPPQGVVVDIRRVTPSGSSPVDFQDGAALPARDLDLVLLYASYVAQEARDLAGEAITAGDFALTAASHATAAAVSAANALASANSAGTSSDSAMGYRNEANAHKLAAADSAASALTYRNQADESAMYAAYYADDAEGFRNEAEGFRDQSQTYRNEAHVAKDVSVGARDASVGAKDTALQAANDAALAASAAGTSAGQAANSATSAASSALAAQNAMDIGTYATSGSLADANVFAVKQGTNATAKNTLLTLYTYIRNKLLGAVTTWTAAHTFNNAVTVTGGDLTVTNRNVVVSGDGFSTGAVTAPVVHGQAAVTTDGDLGVGGSALITGPLQVVTGAIVDGSLSAGVSITTPGYMAASATIACNGGMRSGEHGTVVKQFYMSGTLAPSGTVLTQRSLPVNVTPNNIIGIVAHVRIDADNHVAPNNADASYRYSVGLASGQVTFRVDSPAQPIMSGRSYRLLGFYLP